MKSPETSAKKILVVEDEPAISNVCCRVLTDKGFEVDIAENGKVAQDMIGKKEYELFLIDIRTPEMNGEELYHWLEERHPQFTSSVIFTTGDVMGGDTMRFVEQTTRPFLPKPFASEELKDIVNKALKRVERQENIPIVDNEKV